jgi:hypothetical protein
MVGQAALISASRCHDFWLHNRFRSRDDTTAILTPRVPLRSRSHERCAGAEVTEMYALIDISNQMLEDSAFDMEGEIRF